MRGEARRGGADCERFPIVGRLQPGQWKSAENLLRIFRTWAKRCEPEQCHSFVFPFIHCYRLTFPCCSLFLCHYTGNSCATHFFFIFGAWGTYLLATDDDDSKKATLHRLLAALLATHGAVIADAACPTYAAHTAGQARVIGQPYGDHLKCCDSCQKFLTSF